MGIARKIAFTGAGTIAAIFLVAYLAQRTDILNRFVKGAGTLGAGIGQAVGFGIGSIPANVIGGAGLGLTGGKAPSPTGTTGQLGTTPDIAQQNFSDFVAGLNRLFSGGGLFPEAGGEDIITALNKAASIPMAPTFTGQRPSRVFAIEPSFTDTSIRKRLQMQEANARNARTTPFGGFGSAFNQEVQLRKAIQESAIKYPKFFSNQRITRKDGR